ncbi:hypothetical protein OROMI_014072 [Orobanche minor]
MKKRKMESIQWKIELWLGATPTTMPRPIHSQKLFAQFATKISNPCLKTSNQSLFVATSFMSSGNLQQWFEYCPNVKKRNCPMCKQTCTNENVGRLYFQSIGDTSESSLSQKHHNYDENPEELRREVNRLDGKVVAMASTLELQQKEFKEVKDQLFSCKEQLKSEVTLKNAAVTQAAASQQLLRMKSQELDKSTLECMTLQERNMALAKELAALKLASELDLEEDEVMKLASLGNGVGSKETVDVLRKSLIIRNKTYKELLAKCNILGRGEARCVRKLEKANDKIKKLKSRIEELETTFEIKENEALRVLKDQDIKFKTDSHENATKRPSRQFLIELETALKIKENEALRVLKDQDIKFKTDSHENATKRPSKQFLINETSAMPDIAFCSKKVSDDNDSHNEQERIRSSVNQDENITCSTLVRGFSDKTMPCADNNVPTPDACFNKESEVEMLHSGDKDGVSCSGPITKRRKIDQAGKLLANMDDDDDDEVICYGDINPVQTSLHIRNEIKPPIPVSQPGDHCFSGGLLGPDGTNWHLGKWCKKAQNKGSNANSGDLISIGADGRGGRIKVMRSLAQSTLDTKETSSWAKKGKHGKKPTTLIHSKGHLRMEHFFQKT